MPDRVGDLARWLLIVGLALACGGSEAPGSADRVAASAGAAATENAVERVSADATGKNPARAQPTRDELPLPAFSGRTLAGDTLAISSFIGKRLVIFFFNPETSKAATITEAVSDIAPYRAKNNFRIVGVAVGSDRETARRFVEARGLDFPVIDDSSGEITRQLGLQSPFAMLGIDAQGYVVWGTGALPADAPDAVARIESQLRSELRLPEVDATPPGDLPVAPAFTARVLDRDERFELAKYRGKPVLLVFFLHSCPHCHEALDAIETLLASLPEDRRPVVAGVEITGKTASVRANLRSSGLDFFPVLFDDTGEIQADYGVFAGVPDIVLIDRNGRITGRMSGWRGDEDEQLLRMRVARLSGLPVPLLLRQDGYSGNEVCAVCHDSELATWELTRHSRAYDTLVMRGAEKDPECVRCHVVGFGQPGGFQISPRRASLENVGCESCHGRGGPHQSPEFVSDGNYASACLGCHDSKHSLGFEYATFLPRVSHQRNAQILSLPAEERRRILAERGDVRKNLLPTRASYVGSEICKSCHAREYEAWSAGPHAGALASLEHEGKAGDATCLACHTTGFGRSGGFPAVGTAAEHPDLARVGCESCHGPGGHHAGEEAEHSGSIVSLGDKCDSCVVLQICGSCHDDANDPGFEFAVEAKIDRIRHGAGEPRSNP